MALPAGTVEFMVDKQGGYYFLEVNPRIQVGAPGPNPYPKAVPCIEQRSPGHAVWLALVYINTPC